MYPRQWHYGRSLTSRSLSYLFSSPIFIIVILVSLFYGALVLSSSMLPSALPDHPQVSINKDDSSIKANEDVDTLYSTTDFSATQYRNKLNLLRQTIESETGIDLKSIDESTKPAGSPGNKVEYKKVTRASSKFIAFNSSKSQSTLSEKELLEQMLRRFKPDAENVEKVDNSKCECQLLPDIDLRGNDISSQPIASVQQCCNVCKKTLKCSHFSVSGTTCYLKNGGTEVDARAVISGYIRAACRTTDTVKQNSFLLPPSPMPSRVSVDGPKLCSALEGPLEIDNPISHLLRTKRELSTLLWQLLSGPTGWTCESTAVLVLTYNRPDYLKQTLESLLAAHADPEVRSCSGRGTLLPIFVSQDGDTQQVTTLLENYRGCLVRIQQEHFGVEDIMELPKPPGKKLTKWMYPYYSLSVHYKKALNAIFTRPNGFRHVIVIEEDLPVAADFFEYFIATGPILFQDPSLYCVSSWNDNGQASHAHDPVAVHRTDMFPGLGWMMGRSVWDELSSMWPAAYWDDYIRHPLRRQGRQCLRPELSRTMHIGKLGGASKGALKGKAGNIISHVELSTISVSFSSIDLSYLLESQYEAQQAALLALAKLITMEDVLHYSMNAPDLLATESAAYSKLKGASENREFPVKICYSSMKDFTRLAIRFGIMPDDKAGIPRTAYKGTVQFNYLPEVAHSNELLIFLFSELDLYQECSVQKPCNDSFFQPLPDNVDLFPISIT